MLYLRPERLAEDLPTLRALTRPQHDIERLAERLLPAVAAALGPRFRVERVALSSQIGSGSLPVERLASAGLAMAPAGTGKRGIGSALDELAAAWRQLATPVIGRIADDRLLFDLRCLADADADAFSAQLPTLAAALDTTLPAATLPAAAP